VINELPLADMQTGCRAMRAPSPCLCRGFDLPKADLRSVEPKVLRDGDQQLCDVAQRLPGAAFVREMSQVTLAFGCKRHRLVADNGDWCRE
jgi:hypothetical protein